MKIYGTFILASCILVSVNGRAQSTAKDSVAAENQNSAIFLNASSDGKPREISLGLPTNNSSAVPIFEDGLPVSYYIYQFFPYKSWHGEKECTDKFTPILNQMGIDLMICGHTHSDAFHEPNEQIHYPVLVNSNNGVVDAKADARELKVKVIHDDGKTYIEKTFSAQR